MTLRSASLLSIVGLFVTLGSALAADVPYTCDDGQRLTAAFTAPESDPGSVRLTFSSSQEMVLPQVLSADGGRYADGETEFWIKGREATLTHVGVATTCRTSG